MVQLVEKITRYMEEAKRNTKEYIHMTSANVIAAYRALVTSDCARDSSMWSQSVTAYKIGLEVVDPILNKHEVDIGKAFPQYQWPERG